MKKDIIFTNSHYGKCALYALKNKDNFKLVLQNPNVIALTSIGDTAKSLVSDPRIDKLFATAQYNQTKHGFGFYEIYAQQTFLGIAGFFCHHEENGICPEICIYLLPQHSGQGLGGDITAALVDYAFTVNTCNKIYADAFPENNSTLILNKQGFVARKQPEQFKANTKQFGQIRYELTKEDFALYLLSKIIITEGKNLAPIIDDMTIENLERIRKLWYKYFKQGIPLSNGGVRYSFINPSDVFTNNNPNLQSFNIYRSDRVESSVLDQETIMHFLQEELADNNHINWEEIYNCFCLGSHEGATRILRCIYDPQHNKEMFYPIGGYAFLAAGASTMKPVAYKINLVPTNDTDGGKISLQNLIATHKKYPTCKTLFIELKTTAGAIYTAQELQAIIRFCKEKQMFIIADAAHLNMHFDDNLPLQNMISLCENAGFYDYAIIYTGSKTYGLERARIGFIAMSKKNSHKENLYEIIERDLYRVLGSLGDLPFETMKLLMEAPLEKRQAYLKHNRDSHRFNMNLMLAYLEGIDSKKIDSDLRAQIMAEIPANYAEGIPGMYCTYKPEAGIQMKVDISEISGKYLYNIKILNAEIFSYLLNKMANVVTLHSYQILDPKGTSLRLSFSIKSDVHQGMQAIHDFVKKLKDYPSENRFLFGAAAYKDDKEEVALAAVTEEPNKTRLRFKPKL